MFEKLVPLVVLLNVLLMVWAMVMVGRARSKTGIKAPAMTGHPDFERAVRVQANLIEQSMMFLPALWLCSGFYDARFAGVLGLVWIFGRVLFSVGYYQAASKRGLGFMVAVSANALLLGLGGVGYLRTIFA
jgi:glutathione S-transferase